MAGLLSATLLACAVASQAQNGQWRVLQMSLNLPQFEQTNVRETLMETAPTSASEQRGGVKGVSLATPHDGAQCVPQPELVWDNNGGAGLQVVGCWGCRSAMLGR